MATKKKTSKKTAKKPFSDKAKKGYVTVHAVIGVSERGNVYLVHPDADQTMEQVRDDIRDTMDYEDKQIDVHHVTLLLPFAKVPKVKAKKAKPKKLEPISRLPTEPEDDTAEVAE